MFDLVVKTRAYQCLAQNINTNLVTVFLHNVKKNQKMPIPV